MNRSFWISRWSIRQARRGMEGYGGEEVSQARLHCIVSVGFRLEERTRF